MERNPLIEIRSTLAEAMKAEFPPLEKGQTSIGFYFSFPSVEDIALEAEIIWRRGSSRVDLYLSQKAQVFAPWGNRKMFKFFGDLMETVRPHLAELEPDWTELSGMLVPATFGAGGRLYVPMYHGEIRCGSYTDKQVGEMLAIHLTFGGTALALGQDAFVQLAHGKRNVDIEQSVDWMVRLRNPPPPEPERVPPKHRHH